MQGTLISIEGVEGAGKTVQAQKLAHALTESGRDVELLREPGGTVISEQIRTMVLNPLYTGMSPVAEVLLFQAARAQIYYERVLPAIKAGKVVLMDRTRDSSVVYQGVVRGMGVELIEQLNDISTQKTLPTLTLLLDLPVLEGLNRRRSAGEVNRLDKESTDFHERVREAYLTLAKKNDHGRWVIIDAQKSIDDVAIDILQTVKSKIG